MKRNLSAAHKPSALEPPGDALPEEVEYPCSDGKPFAETLLHADAKVYSYEALQQHFADRSGVFVGCDTLLYYRRGDPQASLVPEVYVAFGAGSLDRDNYKVWEEGKPPDFVLDIVTRTTRENDLESKTQLYAAIGVREYWLLDPKGLLRAEPLSGSRLAGSVYEPIAAVESARERTRLPSDVLGLHLRTKPVNYSLAVELWDPESGGTVLTGLELYRAYMRSKKQLALAKEMLLAERKARMEEEARLARAIEQVERAEARSAEPAKRNDSES